MDVLLGLQWGDEGKGKIVDFLASQYDIVARFQGGPNAGHTLLFKDQKFVLHQIPSGIFHPHIKNVIGNGVVLDPIVLKIEIENVQTQCSFSVVSRLFISQRAHLIIPTHQLLDACYEQHKGERKIGSTLKGIGPAYRDKIARIGLRVGDIFKNDFKEKYEKLTEIHQKILSHYDFQIKTLKDKKRNFWKSIEYMQKIPTIDSIYFINEQMNLKKKVLAEGAQGTLLDVDYGSYPYITSSNTSVGGVNTGLGVAPKYIQSVFGVFKAYCTRVGNGPFPTELFDKTGKILQKMGNEFGATTNRIRRCGWLDLPALKYAIMLNGITKLFITKIDVLGIFEELKICTHYRLGNGNITEKLPFTLSNENIHPIYRSFPGWNCKLDKMTSFKDFPKELLNYIYFIEKETEIPIHIISIGPNKNQVIIR